MFAQTKEFIKSNFDFSSVKKREIEKISQVSDFLEYSHVEGNTLVLKDQSIAKVFSIQGFDYIGLRNEDLDQISETTKKLLEEGEKVELNTYSFRLPKKEEGKKEEKNANSLAEKIHNKYIEQFNVSQELKFFLVIRSKKNNKELAKAEIADFSVLLMQHLADIGVEELDENGIFSFVSTLINLEPIPAKKNYNFISDRLVSNHLSFPIMKDYFLIHRPDRTSYGKILTIKILPFHVQHSAFSYIFRVPINQLCFHRFQTYGKAKSLFLLGKQIRQYEVVKNQIAADELTDLQSKINADLCSLVETEHCFVFWDDDLEFLNDSVSHVVQQLQKTGNFLVTEKSQKKPMYFSIHPGVDGNVRKVPLPSEEACEFFRFQKSSTGSPSFWGKSTANLKTLDGQKYDFNFHINEKDHALGHTLVIGESGRGKTVLMSYLLACSLKIKDLKIRIFDQNQGMRLITEALGYDFIDFTNQGINLFDAEKKESIEFVKALLHIMADINPESQPEESNRLSNAFDDFLEDETLEEKNLQDFLILHINKTDSHIKKSLQRFLDGIYKGTISTKSLDTNSKWINYDFTRFLESENLKLPLSIIGSFLIHEFFQSSQNPKLLFIDELPRFLSDKKMAGLFDLALKQARKKNSVLIGAVQSVSDFFNHPIAQTSFDNFSTYIFFQNGAPIKSEIAEKLGLSEADQAFVSSYPSISSRHILVKKKGQKSVILDINLDVLENYLKLFQTDGKNYEAFRKNGLKQFLEEL